MQFPTIFLCFLFACHVGAAYLRPPYHYSDLELLLLKRMNFSADPCEDFYNYACGNIDTYDELIMRDKNERIVKDGLNKLRSGDYHNLMSSSAINKVVRYYNACVTEHVQDVDGVAYVKQKIDGFLDKFGFPVDLFFNNDEDVKIDRENLSDMLLYVHDEFHVEPLFKTKGPNWFETKLPNPDPTALSYLEFKVTDRSFVENDCNYQKMLDRFMDGVNTVMKAMGLTATKSEVEKVAMDLMEFEIGLLGACQGEKDNRSESVNNAKDDQKHVKSTNNTNGQHGFIKLDKLTFDNWNLDLDSYFKKLIAHGVGDTPINYDNLYIFVDNAFLPKALSKTDDATLLRYIVFRSILNNVNVPPNCFMLMEIFNMVKSRIYTEFKYPSVIEREALRIWGMEILNTTKSTLKKMATSLPWIQNDTSAYNVLIDIFDTLKMVFAIENNVLNNTWIDNYYRQIHFDPDYHFLEMHSEVVKFQMYQKVRDLVYPRENFEVDMSDLNSRYDPSLNKVLIFDGLLVAPIYHKSYPFSFNMGGIGFFIGHEISHALDINKMLTDNKNLLSDPVKKELKTMEKCVIDQYDNMQVLPSNYTPNHVNGTKTIADNTADISGLHAAYRTFKILQKNHEQKHRFQHPKLRELTEDQIFFLGFGELQCQIQLEWHIYNTILTDVHAPNKARVEGSISNLPAFGKAFKCPVGSKYLPAEHCNVWTT